MKYSTKDKSDKSEGNSTEAIEIDLNHLHCNEDDTDNEDNEDDEKKNKSEVPTERNHSGIVVNMLTNSARVNEALTFLNDKTRSANEKKLAMIKNSTSALFWAVRERADDSLIEKMLEYGGNELVILTNAYSENVLHHAAYCRPSDNVIKKLVDLGGKGAILQQDRFGNSAFFCACQWGLSLDVIRHMIKIAGKEALTTTNFKKQVPYCRCNDMQTLLFDIGGEEYTKLLKEQKKVNLKLIDLLMSNRMEEAEGALRDDKRRDELLHRKKEENEGDLNILMAAIWFIGNASPLHKDRTISLVKKLVEVGGRELVSMTNKTKSNSVHYAAFNKLPLEIVKLLVDRAGKDSLKQQNNWGNTPLHDAAFRGAPEDVIEYLTKQSGRKILTTLNKENRTPLDVLFHSGTLSDTHIMSLQRAWYELDPTCSRNFSGPMVNRILLWADSAGPSSVSENNFVKAILNDRFTWHRYQAVLLTDLYAQIGVVIALSPFSKRYLSLGDSRFILSLALTWFLLREVADFFASSLQSYSKTDNLFDLIQICLLFTMIPLQEVENEESVTNFYSHKGLLITLSLIAWIQLLMIIGRLSFKVSVFTYALLQIVFELVPFLLTACLVVFAFGQVYYIAGNDTQRCMASDDGEVHWECRPQSSLFQSFAMLLTAEFDFMEWDEDIDSLLSTVSFVFAIVVGILLFNILIAVVNNVFTKVSDESEDAFWTTRLNFMVEVISIRSFIIRCWNPSKHFLSLTQYRGPHSKKSRTCFSEYNDEWINTCCEEDMSLFYKWWYYPWEMKRPPLLTRLSFFYGEASTNEIFFPGKVLHHVLLGRKYDDEIRAWEYLLVALPVSLIHFTGGIVVVVAIFCLGLLSFGYLWPAELNEMLFFGPIEDPTTGNIKEQSKSMQAVQNLVQDQKIVVLERQVDNLQKQNEEVLSILLKIMKMQEI